MRIAAILIPLLIALAPFTCAAETMVGIALVIDGDTIEIDGLRIRLFGIDAPELAQRCSEHGSLYPCGQDASHALAK